MNFESTYVDPRGRIARGSFISALIILLAAAAFYFFLVGGVSGLWCLVVLIYPFIVLNARRLHDMGQTGWLLIVPAALLIAAAAFNLYDIDAKLISPVTWAALAVSAGIALWGAIGKGKTETNGSAGAAA